MRSPAWVAAQPDLGGVAVGVVERLESEGADVFQCTACGKLYWEGRHIDSAIRSFFGSLLPAHAQPLDAHALGRRVPREATPSASELSD